MGDTVVLVLSGLLALGVPAETMWTIWHTARRQPTRERALSLVLGSVAGTALLGVVLPAVLMGALDPFPIWLGYAVLTAAGAAVLAWRWPALAPATGGHRALVISSCVVLLILAMAGVAVT